jgi:hypothetical protein
MNTPKQQKCKALKKIYTEKKINKIKDRGRRLENVVLNLFDNNVGS